MARRRSDQGEQVQRGSHSQHAALPARSNGARYTEPEIERALIAYAMASGNSRKAARALKDQGMKVDHKTLWRWANQTYPDRYLRVQQEVLPEIYAGVAEELEALARQQLEVQRRAVERVDEELPNMGPRDIAGTVRNLAVSLGITLDKGRLLRDLPTEIRSEKSVPELLQFLSQPKFERVFPGLKDSPLLQTIDSTAEEVEDR